jgi:hypothetical protein
MRAPLFLLSTLLSVSASTIPPGATTRLPFPNIRDGNHFVTEKTLSQLVTLTSTSFFVESNLRRRPRPTPTPQPTPPPKSGQVSLTWNLDTDSTVVGYNLYYTTNPTALTQSMPRPIPGTIDKISGMSVTATTLTGLSSGVVFYFGLTAYNANGIESTLSNVVSTAVP